jgi:hypothetical protein
MHFLQGYSGLKTMTNLNEPLRLAICVAGVYLFYLWYGICQEELYVSTHRLRRRLFGGWRAENDFLPFGPVTSCRKKSFSDLPDRFFCRYKTNYGDTEKKKFTYSVFLLFVQCLMNAFAAFAGTFL